MILSTLMPIIASINARVSPYVPVPRFTTMPLADGETRTKKYLPSRQA
jgi:hypothetical protein